MDPLHAAFAALLPRINSIAAAHHRRSWTPGRPTLADTRQQAALIVYDKLKRGIPDGAIGSLYRDLIDWFRHETHYRSRVVMQVEDEVPSPIVTATPLDRVARAEFGAAVLRRVAALSDRHRYVVRERARGVKIREIAAALSVTPGRVSQLLTEARSVLAPVLEAA